MMGWNQNERRSALFLGALITIFVVPTLYCAIREFGIGRENVS